MNQMITKPTWQMICAKNPENESDWKFRSCGIDVPVSGSALTSEVVLVFKYKYCFLNNMNCV